MGIKSKNALIDGYSLQVVKSIKEIEKIRPFWENKQWHPNADINYYINFINLHSEVFSPYIIALYRDEVPQAMLIGRIQNQYLECKIGYKTIFKPNVKSLAIIYGGILGEISFTNSFLIMKELNKILNKEELDIIYFNHVRLDSDIYKAIKKVPNFLCRDYFAMHNFHWRMSLPVTSEEFFKKISAKHRYWIRRMVRLLEKDFNNEIVIKCFGAEAEVHQLCNDVEEVAKKTYQRGMGVGFINNGEIYKRMCLLARLSRLRSYILYVEGKPCAFWIGTQYGSTFYLDFTGYDPRYRKYEIGTIIFTKMIEDLCYNKIEIIDCGFGEAFYKERFGDHKWEEVSTYIFSPTIKGITCNSLFSLTNAISQLAEGTLSRIDLIRRVKKIWRLRLLNKNQEDNKPS